MTEGFEKSVAGLGTASDVFRSDVFRLFIESVTDYAIFLLDVDGRVLTWNPGAARLKGYTATEIIGRHFSVFYPPEDIQQDKPRQKLKTAAEVGFAEDEGWRLRKDGSRFWASVSITALKDEHGRVRGFGKVTRDLTAHREKEQSERRLLAEQAAREAAEQASERARFFSAQASRLQRISAAFSEALTLGQVADAIGAEVIPALGADAGSLSILSPDGKTLQLKWTSGYASTALTEFASFPLDASLPDSDVARAQKPLFLDSSERITQAYPSIAPKNPLLALAALPLVVAHRTVGVLGLGYRSPHSFPEEDRSFALSLAQQCAQTLERSLIFEREHASLEIAEAATRRLAFLSEASELLSSSLDYEVTLQSVATLTVPRLADWCGIDIAEEDGTTRQLAVAHVDAAKIRYARELREKFPPARETDAVLRVIRTGEAELYEDIPEELLARGAHNAEHLKVIRELQLRSVMIVPIKTRQATIGAISMIWAESGRHYTKDDLALAEELAARAGLAVENASLYRDAQAAIRRREEFLARCIA